MSAYDLIAELRDRTELAPQTVYRALNWLIEQRTVHKLESLNAFVACTHSEHHESPAFAVCDACGLVSEFDAPQLNAGLQSWACRAGFNLRSATLELHGTCSRCQAHSQVAIQNTSAPSPASWRRS